MALKLLALAALVAAAKAGLLASPAVLAPGAPLAAHTFAGPLGFATPIGLLRPGGAGGRGSGQDQGQNQGQQGGQQQQQQQQQQGQDQGGQGGQQGQTQNQPGGSVNTGTIKISAPTAAAIDADYDPNPQYSYAFDIEDTITGDSKSQQETRNGDVVQGSYSLLEADGTRRTVEYSADPVNGFNAIVHREPGAGKAVIAGQAAAKVAASGAPAVAIAHPIAKLASPLTYSPGPYQPYHTKAIIG